MITFCAHQFTTEEARDTRWPESIWRSGLGWSVLSDLPNFSRAMLVDAVNKCFTRISEACAPKFREVDPENAHFLIRTEAMDGAGGVLADCYLPPANPIRMRLDTGERWNSQVNLLPVLLHEAAHGMGMQHDPQRGALLSAFYDPKIQDYTQRDIMRLQALYGPPVNVPPPDPPDASGRVVRIIITNADKIEVPGWKMVPVG